MQDAYECEAAFWSHCREVFKDDTHPKIANVMCNISFYGQREHDLQNFKMWITNSGIYDWKLDRYSDENNNSGDNNVNG